VESVVEFVVGCVSWAEVDAPGQYNFINLLFSIELRTSWKILYSVAPAAY